MTKPTREGAALLCGYILGALSAKGDYRPVEAEGTSGVVEAVANGNRYRFTVEPLPPE